MTESVIEALDNKALGMRDAETDGAPVGAAISRPLQDAARSHDDAAGETDCHGPQAALAMTGTEAARVVEEPDPGILKHLRSLYAQAEELKQDFPDFDLDAALRDPAFLRLTAPALGVGVREAFYALNRPRLDALAAARAAEESKALLAKAVSGGARRPREGGGSGAAALLRSDYAALPRQRQLALKQRIREAAARGEKMYP